MLMEWGPTPSPVGGGSDHALVVWTAVYAIAAALTFGVLLYAAVAGSFQLREMKRTRHASLMADLSRRWDEPLLTDSRLLAASYTPEELRNRVEFLRGRDDPDLYVLQRIPNFLEDLGVLEDMKAIPLDMLRKSLGGTIVETWRHWEPTVAYMRGDQESDLVYENFEGLADKMRQELER